MTKFPEIKKLLNSFKVQDVIDFKNNTDSSYHLSDKNTIYEALQLLKEHNMLSAPVYLSESEDVERLMFPFLDIISLVDICNYVVFNKNLAREMENLNMGGNPLDKSILYTPISDVIKLKETKGCRIEGTVSLMELVVYLVTDKYNYALVGTTKHGKNCQKIQSSSENSRSLNENTKNCTVCEKECLEENEKSITNQSCFSGGPVGITRHDILSFLNNINEKLQDALDLTVEQVMEIIFTKKSEVDSISEMKKHPLLMSKNFKRSFTNLLNPGHEMVLKKELPYRYQDIFYITPHTLAIDGYKIMNYNEISSIPILNDDFRFIAELEVSHFYHISPNNIGLLGKPVLAFLTNIGVVSSILTKKQTYSTIKPKFCSKNFTLNQVMFGMINSKTRQSWVLDESGRIDAVISIVDILDLFSKL
ncbi:hypothetical protein BB559_001404 [Furculomyces boomerangus]|uniref:CBS domain-containing protein n=2 Tax=Harpellales TaxID=61421 RepID=A0A2T9Z244_9FUNG|nr:hypothetical protein BB559_001404 [Furculomyces boomerangus]